jgi:hypothetical protein
VQRNGPYLAEGNPNTGFAPGPGPGIMEKYDDTTPHTGMTSEEEEDESDVEC